MKTVKISSSRYPSLLKQISDPPQQLYYKGKWDSKLFKNCLAVVGARQMTGYGRRATNELVAKIASMGVTIVSGFMYGVDAQAHRAALSVGGKTIAVMPCGIDVIHPSHQKKLYEEIIAANGLIISELETNHPPALWIFPKRNRIVAGLSKAVLVVEAGFDSGSLITADLAKKFNRKLLAVPGPITSSLSQGTLQLIKNGADLASDANDILVNYGLNYQEYSMNRFSAAGLNKLERGIIDKLTQEPKDIDTLSRLVNISISDLGATLSLMQLRGIVTKEKDKYHFIQEKVC
ncbi:MAG: DNA-protecting protein DprA [Candidatus Omnitrophica bacterium]|nr:DNA-protecting protein DprA [Candidatus Omnitrophota bacterium]